MKKPKPARGARRGAGRKSKPTVAITVRLHPETLAYLETTGISDTVPQTADANYTPRGSRSQTIEAMIIRYAAAELAALHQQFKDDPSTRDRLGASARRLLQMADERWPLPWGAKRVRDTKRA